MGQTTRTLTLVDGTIEDGFVETALKVAFATGDLHHVDQHFGTCETISIYLVNRDQAHFHQSITFEMAEKDGKEDKLKLRIDALSGCAALYCRAIGASAIAQLMRKGVQPIKVASGTSIKTQLFQLQEELRADPALWVVKALEAQNGLSRDPNRFDDMELEGWSE